LRGRIKSADRIRSSRQLGRLHGQFVAVFVALGFGFGLLANSLNLDFTIGGIDLFLPLQVAYAIAMLYLTTRLVSTYEIKTLIILFVAVYLVELIAGTLAIAAIRGIGGSLGRLSHDSPIELFRFYAYGNVALITAIRGVAALAIEGFLWCRVFPEFKAAVMRRRVPVMLALVVLTGIADGLFFAIVFQLGSLLIGGSNLSFQARVACCFNRLHNPGNARVIEFRLACA
jgi:hypothetical protein